MRDPQCLTNYDKKMTNYDKAVLQGRIFAILKAGCAELCKNREKAVITGMKSQLSSHSFGSVKTPNQDVIKKLLTRAELLPEPENLPVTVKENLENSEDTAGDLLNKITSTAEKITAVTGTVNGAAFFYSPLSGVSEAATLLASGYFLYIV